MPPSPPQTAQSLPSAQHQPALPFRIGLGYDLHRLQPRASTPDSSTPDSSTPQPVRPLILGGVLIPHDKGPVAHSDGDALLHALTDALLGALALPDIGQLFPDTDPRHNAQDSSIFLLTAADAVARAGYHIANLDATIILQRPKLAPHKDAIRDSIARLLNLSLDQVNIKGKTHEHLGDLGAGNAVEVHAVVLLHRLSLHHSA